MKRLADATRRHSLGADLTLALVPTATILGVLAVVERLGHERILFASLAASAFLIYLDPEHRSNSVRTLVVSQISAALLGYGAQALVGPGYAASAAAVVAVVVLLVTFDVVHPPAVATGLSFAFRTGTESRLVLFGVAVGLVVVLVGVQQVSTRIAQRVQRFHPFRAHRAAHRRRAFERRRAHRRRVRA